MLGQRAEHRCAATRNTHVTGVGRGATATWSSFGTVDRVAPFKLSSSRTYLDAFAQRAAATVTPDGAVLDAGAGTAPYGAWFTERGTYHTADHIHSGGPPLTFVCDLTAIPVSDASYDLVFCSQVLEHLPAPRAVLGELARALKPGGKLWLTTPLFYPEHEQPFDFFRYTQFGLKYLIEGSGLQIQEIQWLEGYLGTVGFQLTSAANDLPTGSRHYGGGLRGLAIGSTFKVARPLLRRAGQALDSLDEVYRITDRGMPKNYTVIARKPPN